MSWWFPLPSKVAAPQSGWSKDQGVDIAAPGHTPLYAVASGTIVKHGIGGFGNFAPVLKLDAPVKLADGREVGYVYYGHAGPGNRVADGTHVQQGQPVGEVGAGIFGISTGPHLEIGLADVRGTPVRDTSAAVFGLLTGAISNKMSWPTAPKSFSAKGTVDLPKVDTSGNDGGGVAAPGATLPTTVALDAAKAAFGAIWDGLKGQASYAGLVVVLLAGAVFLTITGVKRTAGANQPAPA